MRKASEEMCLARDVRMVREGIENMRGEYMEEGGEKRT